MYFVKSSTTATLQHWPARLVPAPRGRIGAPNFRHAATAATHVVFVARNDEADRNLAVVRGVGGVQRAAAAVEAHFAADLPLQLALELGGSLERVDGFRVRAEGQRLRSLTRSRQAR